MNEELIEYLRIIEMKLQSLMQDIQNIRDRLEHPVHVPLVRCHRASFFTALQADDNNYRDHDFGLKQEESLEP